MAQLSLTSCLLDPGEAVLSNKTLEIFSTMLAGISPQEAALYQLEPPQTEDQLNIDKWARWKASLENIGARNH